jgi:hypothetical protein
MLLRIEHIVVVICAGILYNFSSYYFVTFMNFVRSVCYDPGWLECGHNTNNIQDVN